MRKYLNAEGMTDLSHHFVV